MKHNLQPPANPVVDVKSAVDVEKEVYLIIADILDVDLAKIQPSSRYRDDLGADSLDIVMLIMEYGRAFDAEICDREVLSIQTVGESIAYLEQHLYIRLPEYKVVEHNVEAGQEDEVAH